MKGRGLVLVYESRPAVTQQRQGQRERRRETYNDNIDNNKCTQSNSAQCHMRPPKVTKYI